LKVEFPCDDELPKGGGGWNTVELTEPVEVDSGGGMDVVVLAGAEELEGKGVEMVELAVVVAFW
jgi:hypothetical protein